MLSFWSHAGAWMLRMSLLVALFKLGGTLLWAAAAGYGVTLDFWFGFIPHFDFQIGQDRFVRLVTLSTWLGIIGAGAGLLWAFVAGYRLNTRHVAHRQRLADAGAVATGGVDHEDADDEDTVHDTDEANASGTAAADAAEIGRIGPSVDELLVFDHFTERVSHAGLWLGAWIGSMTLLATIGFEMFRHYYVDAYVWQAQHLVATLVATVPVFAVLALVFMGRFRATLPVADIESLLTASGFEVVELADLDESVETGDSDDDTDHDGSDDDHDGSDAVTPIATALGS